MKAKLMTLLLGLVLLTGTAFTFSHQAEPTTPPKSLAEEYKLFKQKAAKLKKALKERPKDRRIKAEMGKLIKYFDGRVKFYAEKDDEAQDAKDECIKNCIRDCQAKIPNSDKGDAHSRRIDCYSECRC